MVHQFLLNGYSIALDVHSGAVHRLDPLAYDLLSELAPPLADTCPQEVINKLSDRYGEEEIREAYAELLALYTAGTLFSPDEYRPFADMLKPAPIKALCLHVAHDCNLRCAYCFAAQGDFGHGRKLMDAGTGRAAIDFLIRNSGTRYNLEVDFFGGEPLLDLDVCKEIVAYARSLEKAHNKNFRFTMTTNGLLVDDDAIDFINREMSNVVLSIDGRREVNDRLRVRPGGGGSYDEILPVYRTLIQSRGEKDYYVRGTFTRHNLDFTSDVLHLWEAGFDQISVEPVVADPRLAYAVTEDDLPRVFAEYERLASTLLEMRRRGEHINFFHFMLDLTQGPCAIKRLRGCGCGNEYVAITPEGDIYPCHQFVGMEEYKMGQLPDDRLDEERRAEFARAHIYAKEGCAGCWAKFYCSGGCNANNRQYAGAVLTPHRPSCELEKKRLECALMLNVALSDQE